MNINKKVWVLVIPFFLLSACSWQSKVYSPPKNELTANVYFDVPKHIDIGLFADQSCKVGKYGANITKAFKHAKRVSVGEIHKRVPYYRKSNIGDRDIKVLALPTRQPLVMSLYYTTDFDQNNIDPYYSEYYRCTITSKFMLRPNSEYIVRFTQSGRKCLIYVFDIERSNHHKRFLPPVKFQTLGRHCVK